MDVQHQSTLVRRGSGTASTAAATALSTDLAVGQDPGQVACGGHVAVHPRSHYLRDGGEGGVGGEGRGEGDRAPHQLQLHRHQCRDGDTLHRSGEGGERWTSEFHIASVASVLNTLCT